MVIEKPVLDRLTPLGPCRPDFLLEARSRVTGEVRQLVVEAMGGATAGFLASKRSAFRALEEIAPVLRIEPSVIEAHRTYRVLAAALEGNSAR